MKKVLTERQMIKAKFIVGFCTILCLGLLTRDFYVYAEETYYSFNDEDDYRSTESVQMSKGKIVYYSYNSEVCNR